MPVTEPGGTLGVDRNRALARSQRRHGHVQVGNRGNKLGRAVPRLEQRDRAVARLARAVALQGLTVAAWVLARGRSGRADGLRRRDLCRRSAGGLRAVRGLRAVGDRGRSGRVAPPAAPGPLRLRARVLSVMGSAAGWPGAAR